MEAYCRKYGLANVEYQFPTDGGSRSRLFRHLLANKERKILFAFIPKVNYDLEQGLHVFAGVLLYVHKCGNQRLCSSAGLVCSVVHVQRIGDSCQSIRYEVSAVSEATRRDRIPLRTDILLG